MLYSFNVNQNSDNGEIHIYEEGELKSICRLKGVVKDKFLAFKINGKQKIYFTEDEVRVIAAKLQNRGYNLCGVCMSHLYKTE